MIARSAQIALLICCHFVLLSTSLANETVAIGEVLSKGSSYHLHSIQLQGLVTNVRKLSPLIGRTKGQCILSEPHVLTLEDQTGAIDVVVYGQCNVPTPVPHVSVGDKVFVYATIRADKDRTTAIAEELRLLDGTDK